LGEGATNRINIAANTAWLFTVNVIAKTADSANVKIWTRRGLIANDGGSTTISALDTIGTDSVIGTLGASIAITADDTNDALKVEATGVAATTIDWVARIDITQVG